MTDAADATPDLKDQLTVAGMPTPTPEQMAEMLRVKPQLVAQIRFVERTEPARAIGERSLSC